MSTNTETDTADGNRPMPAALQTQFGEQIRALLQTCSRDARRGAMVSTTDIDALARVILGAYQQLWQLGFRLQRIDNVGKRHLQALVKRWRVIGLSRGTAVQRWRALNRWLPMIGKAGMMPPLQDLWPADAPALVAAKTQQRVSALSDQEFSALRTAFGEFNPTLAVLELERAFGMTRQEALCTNFVVSARRSRLHIVVCGRVIVDARVVHVTTAAQAALIERVLTLLNVKRRERLRWPELSIDAATEKVSSAVARQMRKLRLGKWATVTTAEPRHD